MADFDFEMGERAPELTTGDDGAFGETSFSFSDTSVNNGTSVDAAGAVAGEQPVAQRLLQGAMDDYYNNLAEKGATPPLGRDVTKFELFDGRLRLKDFPNVELINKNTGRPLASSTVTRQPGGGAAIREGLGFPEGARWGGKKLSAQADAALQTADRELRGAAGSVGTVGTQDLGQIAKEASDTTQRIVTTLTDTGDDPPLNLREIRGLDRALQRIRGELTNNLAKLSELDEHIASEKRKLGQEGTDEVEKRRIAERLGSLQDERAARLEAAAANREALRSQINRVRETISRILHEDTTLAERIRTLFREQGITIASILTAIGMAISALVFALTGSGGGAAPTPPPSKGGVREWLKKTLHALGRLLAKLAGKAAAALPGVIGSVVSWLLGAVAKTTGWLASNLWALVLAAGGALLLAAHEWISRKPKHE